VCTQARLVRAGVAVGICYEHRFVNLNYNRCVPRGQDSPSACNNTTPPHETPLSIRNASANMKHNTWCSLKGPACGSKTCPAACPWHDSVCLGTTCYTGCSCNTWCSLKGPVCGGTTCPAACPWHDSVYLGTTCYTGCSCNTWRSLKGPASGSATCPVHVPGTTLCAWGQHATQSVPTSSANLLLRKQRLYSSEGRNGKMLVANSSPISPGAIRFVSIQSEAVPLTRVSYRAVHVTQLNTAYMN
jgi:hypothetical protein